MMFFIVDVVVDDGFLWSNFLVFGRCHPVKLCTCIVAVVKVTRE